MIVRPDREKVILALQLFLNAKINNFELDDSISFKTQDNLVAKIVVEVCNLISEFEEHFCCSEAMRNVFERFILLLQSDYQIQTDHSTFSRKLFSFFNWACGKQTRKPYWPFANRLEWEEFLYLSNRNDEMN